MPEDAEGDLLGRMEAIAEAVNRFTSPEVQKMAFEALVGGVGPTSSGGSEGAGTQARTIPRKAAAKKAAVTPSTNGASGPKKRGGGKKQSFTLLKDVDLYGPTPNFPDFCTEKLPTTNIEKCVVAVYWLVQHGGVSPVTIDHVYTAFKDRAWVVPPNLANTLQQAGTRGYLDSSDRQNLSVPTKGENLVEHNLPKE